MGRASILGDAIEYLKELLQKINDLRNELELTPSSSSMLPTDTTSFHPLTPTPATTLPYRVKEELCPSPCLLPSPDGQPARVSLLSFHFLYPIFFIIYFLFINIY